MTLMVRKLVPSILVTLIVPGRRVTPISSIIRSDKIPDVRIAGNVLEICEAVSFESFPDVAVVTDTVHSALYWGV